MSTMQLNHLYVIDSSDEPQSSLSHSYPRRRSHHGIICLQTDTGPLRQRGDVSLGLSSDIRTH